MAYRSELTGLYRILAVVNQLCKFYGIEEGQVEVGCNGSSALRAAFDRDPILSYDLPDYDIVGAIYYLRRYSTVTWTYRHVKGHQDDLSDDLDLWIQRNVLMDSHAKGHLGRARQSPRHFNIEGEPWQLWVKGAKVTADITSAIYSAVHDRESEEYWSSKHHILLDSLKEVDWQLIGTTMKSLPRARRTFLTKHVSGMCGVGKFMKRWKE